MTTPYSGMPPSGDWLDDMAKAELPPEPEKKLPYERVWVDIDACPTCGRAEVSMFGAGAMRIYQSYLDPAKWEGYNEVIGEIEMKFRTKNGHHVHFLRRESEK